MTNNLIASWMFVDQSLRDVFIKVEHLTLKCPNDAADVLSESASYHSWSFPLRQDGRLELLSQLKAVILIARSVQFLQAQTVFLRFLMICTARSPVVATLFPRYLRVRLSNMTRKETSTTFNLSCSTPNPGRVPQR